MRYLMIALLAAAVLFASTTPASAQFEAKQLVDGSPAGGADGAGGCNPVNASPEELAAAVAKQELAKAAAGGKNGSVGGPTLNVRLNVRVTPNTPVKRVVYVPVAGKTQTIYVDKGISDEEVRRVVGETWSGPARTNSERWSVDEALSRGVIGGRRYKPALDDKEWQSPTKRWETAEALRRHDSSAKAHPEAFARHNTDSASHPDIRKGVTGAQSSADRAQRTASAAYWIALILLILLLAWLLGSLIAWLLRGRVGPFLWRPAPFWGGGGGGGGGAVIGAPTPPAVWTP